MTYTVSHRQAGVQRSAVAGLVRHEFRDVDKHNGVETQHSNERIVPERTHLNESVLWVDGEPVELTDSRQITAELDRRLEGAGGTRTNKKTGEVRRIAVRQDAKVVRDVVLQLDPQFTRSSEHLVSGESGEHDETVRSHLDEMVEHYAELYGKENLLAASLHLDETSPHIHLLVTPIDDQGRVRQESFIKGRQAMRDNDQAMRRRLDAAGYDVDKQPRGGNRSNMSIDEYAQWQQRIQEIDAREVEVDDRELRLDRRSARQEQAETAHDAREASLSDRERKVESQAAEAAKVRQKGVQALSEAKELREWASDEARDARRQKQLYEERFEQMRELDEATREMYEAMKAEGRTIKKNTRLGRAKDAKIKKVASYRDGAHPEERNGHQPGG